MPASLPVGGVVAAAGAALIGTDALDAIDKGLTAVETHGIVPDGIASGPAIGSALRAAYRAIGATPAEIERNRLRVPGGARRVLERDGGRRAVGGWNMLVIGIREDIRFETSDSAILQDAAGAIIVNSFQDDMVAMRCSLRMGAAIGRPVGGTERRWSRSRWSTGRPRR